MSAAELVDTAGPSKSLSTAPLLAPLGLATVAAGRSPSFPALPTLPALLRKEKEDVSFDVSFDVSSSACSLIPAPMKENPEVAGAVGFSSATSPALFALFMNEKEDTESASSAIGDGCDAGPLMKLNALDAGAAPGAAAGPAATPAGASFTLMPPNRSSAMVGLL
jgi:hypothetical protein